MPYDTEMDAIKWVPGSFVTPINVDDPKYKCDVYWANAVKGKSFAQVNFNDQVNPQSGFASRPYRGLLGQPLARFLKC